MRFLIEFDGPIANVAEAYYAAYVEAATQVGWSKLDQPTFWRLIRTKGPEGDLLPRASDFKLKDYRQRFNELLEKPSLLQRYSLAADSFTSLSKLIRHGPLGAITLGVNATERGNLLKGWKLASMLPEIQSLAADPRQRPNELKAWAKGDRRTIIVASSDAIIRAADSAELFTVGLSCGPCGAERLHRAGPRIVMKNLDELATSLCTGAADLIRAGLLPMTPGL
ncbi:MAG: hypothetical protein HY287_04800 [Planctomycetes bacterium]|nr:hypothetical protein [Planctomycetota bacterium]MBI3833632.1 hypothetical protein [Planctomycetota bacterium]